MLQRALEVEVDEFLRSHQALQDAQGRRLVVRNGRLPERPVVTGAGPLPVQQPRVRDRRGVEHPEAVHFTSSILPRYLRRSKSVDELIPWLYLRGISQAQMQPALEALLGPEVRGLSANVVSRLTAEWSQEMKAWSQRDLSDTEYVYVWADGVYFNIRLEEDRQCILVLLGATKDGRKELIAIQDGYRESEQSWRELLLDVKQRGLKVDPRIAVGDGALGFWAALRKVYPETREQRCWMHKTGNVLNKMPKKVQGKAKSDLHQIWMAETRASAHQAFDGFVEKYQAKYPAAVECLVKDRDVLLTFYDFPAEHWQHLRTTNPIESTFSTVRLRHRRTKGSGTRVACLAMVFKLMQLAEKSWRRLKRYQRLLQLLSGHQFVDGVLQERNAA
jgi:transposase-like protein